MKSSPEIVALFITLGGGMWHLIPGLKYRRNNKTRQVGTLFLFMALCAFVFSSGILIKISGVSQFWERIILVVQAIIVGVWLGVFIAMRILGCLNLPRKSIEASVEDSEKQ